MKQQSGSDRGGAELGADNRALKRFRKSPQARVRVWPRALLPSPELCVPQVELVFLVPKMLGDSDVPTLPLRATCSQKRRFGCVRLTWRPSALQSYVKVELFPTSVLTVFLTWNLRYRYCRMLEEGSFRGRTADFVFMFLFGGFLMTVSFNK